MLKTQNISKTPITVEIAVTRLPSIRAQPKPRFLIDYVIARFGLRDIPLRYTRGTPNFQLNLSENKSFCS